MLVNSVVGAMDGGMDEGRVGWMEGSGVGFILGSLHFSLSDGQKTNRSFEKKKGTDRGRRRESRGENKHSPGRSPRSPSFSSCRHDHKFV